MKRVAYAFLAIWMTGLPARAQTGINGTWRLDEAGRRWEVFLKADGARLTGIVGNCATVAPVEISGGVIEGSSVRFECRRTDGVSSIALTGAVAGDRIEFSWRTVGAPAGAGNPVFGPSAPPRFVARRVPDGGLAALFGQARGVELAGAINLPDENTKIAGLLFLPDRVRRVRAVILAVQWGNGDPFYAHQDVRRMLEATDTALLLVRYTTIGGAVWAANRWNPRSGTLPLLLQRLAEESGHPEIKDAPLVIWGHSAAGNFGSTFADAQPGRTVAFVAYHSAAAGADGVSADRFRVPALLIAGGKDPAAPAAAIEANWKQARSAGAPWTLAVDPDADHASEDALNRATGLMVSWITAVLRQRLSSDATLRSVDESGTWLGDSRTGQVSPSGSFAGATLEASWLPDEQTADVWRRMTTAGN